MEEVVKARLIGALTANARNNILIRMARSLKM